jgi:hypothetical protein
MSHIFAGNFETGRGYEEHALRLNSIAREVSLVELARAPRCHGCSGAGLAPRPRRIPAGRAPWWAASGMSGRGADGPESRRCPGMAPAPDRSPDAGPGRAGAAWRNCPRPPAIGAVPGAGAGRRIQPGTGSG